MTPLEITTIGLTEKYTSADKEATVGQGPHRTLKRNHDKLEAYRVWLSLPAGENKFTDVAKELGIDRRTAENRVKAAQAMFGESIDLMAQRLFLDSVDVNEAMRAKAIGGVNEHTGEYEAPDPTAANAYYKGNEQTRKLFGLDKPVRTDVTTDGEKITIQITPDWTTGQGDG